MLGNAYNYALHLVSEKFLKRFQCSSDCRWPYLVSPGRSSSASSFHDSLLRAIDGVMSLALYPQVVSQALQHFRSPEKQATCEGCFARSVIFLHFCMSRAVHIHHSIIRICRFQVLEFKRIRRIHASWPVKRRKYSVIAISSFILYQYLSLSLIHI